MEKYPEIKTGQFTVLFLDRNTGIILDQNFNYHNSDIIKAFSVHESLKNAIESAENKTKTIKKDNIDVGYYIRDEKKDVVLHTDNSNNPDQLKIIYINGDKFSDIEGFYNEIDKVLTSELEWKTGHNLNAFNDLLYGGFGVHEYKEPIKLVWTNSAKSKKELSSFGENKTLYQSLIEIIKYHDHIKFTEY